MGRSVSVAGVVPPDASGDEAFAALVSNADPVTDNGHVTTTSGPTSWAPIDLGPVLDALAAGEIAGEQPTMLTRTDGIPLLYPGRTHSLSGETESGKTWIAAHACAERLQAGETVAYIDYEDTAPTITGRMLAVGAHPDAIRERFCYLSPSEQLMGQPEPVRDLDAVLAREPTLVVLDGVTESYALENLSINDNSDVAKWNDRIPRRIAKTGPAVLLLDHVVKDRENQGRWAIGGQHKLAGLDGAAYTVSVVKPFAVGQDGMLSLKVAKDRHGNVRAHAVGKRIADVNVRSVNGGVSITLDAPADQGQEDFRPTALMERVSKALLLTPGMTVRDVEGLEGRAVYLSKALRQLVAEGYVRVENGPRGSRRHYSVKPFTETDSSPTSPVSPPSPDRLRETVGDTPERPSPVSPPFRGDGGDGRSESPGDTPSEADRLPWQEGPL